MGDEKTEEVADRAEWWISRTVVDNVLCGVYGSGSRSRSGGDSVQTSKSLLARVVPWVCDAKVGLKLAEGAAMDQAMIRLVLEQQTAQRFAICEQGKAQTGVRRPMIVLFRNTHWLVMHDSVV